MRLRFPRKRAERLEYENKATAYGLPKNASKRQIRKAEEENNKYVERILAGLPPTASDKEVIAARARLRGERK